MNNDDVDTPERLPWTATCLMLAAGAIGWVSLLLPEVVMFGMVALIVALPTTILATLTGTQQTRGAHYFRIGLGIAGMAGAVPLLMIEDGATCRIAFGLGTTAYLVLLSSFSRWGSSPLFLLLVAVASAGATAVTFIPPYLLSRAAIATKTLLYSLPLGLALGLAIGFVKRRR